MRAGSCLALGIVLALACAREGVDPNPGPGPHAGDAPAPRPMGRAVRPRSGHLTYQLHSVKRAEDETRVDLLFRNGTSRNFEAILVRVIALSSLGKRVVADTPLGPMSRGTSKRHRVYFRDLAFPVYEVLVEVLYTYP